jgi:predicted aspartyl protease
MTAKNGEGTFPIVTVKVNGVTCRALVDSGAGSIGFEYLFEQSHFCDKI